MKKKLASVFMASTIFAGMLAGCGTAKIVLEAAIQIRLN